MKLAKNSIAELGHVRALIRGKQFEHALEEVGSLLKQNNGCPTLWNLRGDLIQLLDAREGPSLKEAERSYLMALKLAPRDLDATEGLAHFYDAVMPNTRKAKQYARQLLQMLKRRLLETEKILSEKD
jgi:tetratricopeptide (TPR) repeat protein